MTTPAPPTVGVTAGRRADEQARLLQRLGLRVIKGAALATIMTADDGPLLAVTEVLLARPPDILIADTGIGIRSWFEAAGRWGRAADLAAALAGVEILARGPKADGALKSAGLPVAWRAPTEQLAEVIGHVAPRVRGKRVALQLHGEDEEAATTRLRQAGADVVEVPVYRWAEPADHAPALRLIELTIDGNVDALTFTAAPAVHNLFALAAGAGVEAPLTSALNSRTLVVCVGPVCAQAARQRGVADPRYPDHWRLGSMVRLVGELLSAGHETAVGDEDLSGDEAGGV